MSAVFFAVQTEVVCIDFFGFPVAILKEWWDENLYLAVDANGCLNMYNNTPVMAMNMWHSTIAQNSFSNILLEFVSYDIEGLMDWVNDNWNKQAWRMQDFPIWSRP